MTTKTTHPTVANARKQIANMRSFIRRDGITGWVKDRSALGQYGRAFEAIVRVEDAIGVEAAADLADRLTALRHEGERAGLIDRAKVGDVERRAVARVDADNARRAR